MSIYFVKFSLGVIYINYSIHPDLSFYEDTQEEVEKSRQDALEMAEKAHETPNANAETPENESNLILFRIFSENLLQRFLDILRGIAP